MRRPVLASLLASAALLGCADEPSDRAGLLPEGDGGSTGRDAARVRPDAEPPLADGDAPDLGALDLGLEPDGAGPGDGGPDAERGPGPSDAAAPEPDGAPPDCPLGARCNPVRVDRFPFVDERDTRDAPAAENDRYACAPDTDESGPEVYYRLDIAEPGVLRITVSDGAGVDVDVHLLEGLDPESCIARHDAEVVRRVAAGRLYVVADTWVDGSGEVQAGAYTMRFELAPLPAAGDCATLEEPLAMRWGACAAEIDCFVGEGPRGPQTAWLRMPAVGPVVREAHLVTVAEVASFPGGWPSAARDGIPAHYALSQEATGYVMDRREPWAPEGEGGSRWGQGSTGRPLPVLDEAWYITMNWERRPAPGRRMIVRNPANGRAVVASAGYETGPGANTAIAGVTEEIHHHLGTNHRGVLAVGFAVDDGLPLGPVECD